MPARQKRDVVQISISGALPKGKKYVNYWADYMELCCFFSADGEYTAADLAVTVGGNGNDISQEMSENIFSFLESRKYLFSGSWPFNIKRGPDRISLKSKRTVKQDFYVALLLSSNLGLFKRNFHYFTSAFEHISEKLLKTYLPIDSQVYCMGAGNILPDSAAKSKKETPLDKMKFVAEQTRMKLCDEKLLGERKSGDFHIDVAGWKKYKKQNKAPGTVIMLGQCTCGKEWDDKQYKITRSALSKLFNISESVIPVMMIPHSLRNTSGEWEHPMDVCPIILLDRLSFIRELPEPTMANLFGKFYRKKLTELASSGRVEF